ncbi:CIA30 family protein [Mycolicibacterium sp. PAM1]|uniref:CIA30 family protein n=1 Tax=Mycolicibacterium sp. PAM1 TaxID=2853535 RepID=UPI001C3C5BEB|nr:CIA30 family protein [Mycolicibacterium sp. PAM1]MBV5242331.1 CIA30 family protein [Mycolicibacterium sp. PAM1]
MATSWRLGAVSACAALLVVSCGSGDETSVPAAGDVVLVDLAEPGEVAAWTTVNDPVMGGTSTSKVRFGDGGLVFSGDISLENNGGFASARGPQDPDIGRRAAGATALRVHARGDGKTYLLTVGIADQPWSYIQRFGTEAGIDRTYGLPVEDFEPVGMRLDPEPDAPKTLDPAGIDQLSVYILDKQQGPFTITVRAVDATTQS